MSYTTTFYHIIIRTRYSEPSIVVEHERELYAYMLGIARNLGCTVYRIGGMPDHVHLFVSLPSTLAIAVFVQRLKVSCTKWMKGHPGFPEFKGWSHEYAAFSYGVRDKDKIVRYIMNQKEHHRQVSFAEEYHSFLEENAVAVDERFFMKD